jgi:hypothetical protein
MTVIVVNGGELAGLLVIVVLALTMILLTPRMLRMRQEMLDAARSFRDTDE